MPNNLNHSGKKAEFISIIYNQNNDSPKYFELKKSTLLSFVIALPTITLISLTLGAIGLLHTSPFHLLDNYRKNAMAREAIAKTNSLISQIKKSENEKSALIQKLQETQLLLDNSPAKTEIEPALATNNIVTNNSATLGKATATAPSTISGLSALSLFRPIQNQHDKTTPGNLNLSDFKVLVARDSVYFQFNIIPALGREGKLAGHIIVFMKNELGIQIYPQASLRGSENQINYLSGESFTTQRFRPVNANFLKPRKAGNYTFTIYIFAKNGDLIHYQSTILPIKF